MGKMRGLKNEHVSAFSDLLRRREFIVTAELNPPKSAAAAVVRRRATVLRGCVDAVNVTDNNRAIVSMAAIPAAVIVRDAGLDPIVQITGRDRNRIALQSDLLGAVALGLEHFLFMTGDDPRRGSDPQAVHVKDLGGIDLVRMAVRMRDERRLLSGEEIRDPMRYDVGATASPFTAPMEADVAKTVEKVRAGADFLQTQPVFDVPAFTRWLAEVRRQAGREVAILAGVFVLRSADQAERIAAIPGIAVPPSVVGRLAKASDPEAEGIAIAIEDVRALRALPGTSGVHLYALEWPEAVVRVVEGAGLLPRPIMKEAVS